MVKLCAACQELRNSNTKQPMISSELPDYPFQVVGTDLFHWNGHDNLIVVDYYSRYWQILRLRNTTIVFVIQKLKEIVSRFGIPEVVRSDNGPQFRSRKFAEFSHNWTFLHNTSSPKYPQRNSLAERSIQTAKLLLTKSLKTGEDPYLALLEYRNTSVNNFATPAQLLMSRNIRSTIPVTRDHLQAKLIDVAQFKEKRLREHQNQKSYYDVGTKQLSELQEREVVRVKEGKEWKPAVVVKKETQPRSYIIKQQNGGNVRRNRIQLMLSVIDSNCSNKNLETESILSSKKSDNARSRDEYQEQLRERVFVTRSGRQSRAPDRYGDYVMDF